MTSEREERARAVLDSIAPSRGIGSGGMCARPTAIAAMLAFSTQERDAAGEGDGRDAGFLAAIREMDPDGRGIEYGHTWGPEVTDNAVLVERLEAIEALIAVCEEEFTSEMTETDGDPDNGPWRDEDDEAVSHGLAEDGHTVVPGSITFGHIRRARQALAALRAPSMGEAEGATNNGTPPLSPDELRAAVGQYATPGLSQEVL